MSTLQEERSAETRRRLLDAAVECIYARGYAGTTTTEIAERAGVSRGAQLHHYPKKDELVVSALEHLFELRLEEMHAAVAEPPSGDRAQRLSAVIDAMWPFFKGPSFYAWLELVVASRTEPTLSPAVRTASDRFADGFRAALSQILIWPESHARELDDLITLVFGQLESLALKRVLHASEAPDRAEIARAIESLKRLGAHLIAQSAGPGGANMDQEVNRDG